MLDWFCNVAGERREGINFELLMTSARKGTEVVYKMGPSEHLSPIAGDMMTVGKSEWVMVQDIGDLFLPMTILALQTRGHIEMI